jgi:excisionase family DNA binding protein
MFTARMIAERWYVSERAVRELIARGVLRHVRLGRLIRIPEDALVEIERVGVSRLVGPRAGRAR